MYFSVSKFKHLLCTHLLWFPLPPSPLPPSLPPMNTKTHTSCVKLLEFLFVNCIPFQSLELLQVGLVPFLMDHHSSQGVSIQRNYYGCGIPNGARSMTWYLIEHGQRFRLTKPQSGYTPLDHSCKTQNPQRIPPSKNWLVTLYEQLCICDQILETKIWPFKQPTAQNDTPDTRGPDGALFSFWEVAACSVKLYTPHDFSPL